MSDRESTNGLLHSRSAVPPTILQRIKRFAGRPPGQKAHTLRFLLRQSLAKLPFVPVPIRLEIAPEDVETFWWSYVVPPFHAERGFLDYWGEDVGDLRFLWRILRANMVFFDVGAYHGFYTLVAARKLRGRGLIVAFEPSPREHRRLRLHLRLNGLSSVRCEPLAAAAASARRRFFVVSSADTTMNSLRHPAVEGAIEETLVETVSLDHYCRQNGLQRVDVLKVDAEGGELEVFAGATGLLESCRPLILCEVLDKVTQPWGYRAREIVDMLRRFDYEWFDLLPTGDLQPHVRREDYPEVRNYLAVPMEKRAEIEQWISV